MFFSKLCYQFGGAIEQSRNSKLLGDSYDEIEVTSGAEVVINKNGEGNTDVGGPPMVAQSL